MTKAEKSELVFKWDIFLGLMNIIKLQTLGSSEVFYVMSCNLSPMVL